MARAAFPQVFHGTLAGAMPTETFIGDWVHCRHGMPQWAFPAESLSRRRTEQEPLEIQISPQRRFNARKRRLSYRCGVADRGGGGDDVGRHRGVLLRGEGLTGWTVAWGVGNRFKAGAGSRLGRELLLGDSAGLGGWGFGNRRLRRDVDERLGIGAVARKPLTSEAASGRRHCQSRQDESVPPHRIFPPYHPDWLVFYDAW